MQQVTEEFSADSLDIYLTTVVARFENKAMADTTRRVARNPKQKLAANERVMAPEIRAETLGLDVTGYAAAVAAALRLRDSAIPGVDELRSDVRERGVERFITEWCGVDPGGRLHNQITEIVSDDDEPGSRHVVSELIVIKNPSGLHARPAAEIVESVKSIDATIHIRKGDKLANANSIMSVLALGATTGDTVTVEAQGDGAAAAVDALRQIMQATEH